MITINFQRQLDLCVSLHWTRLLPVWDSPPVYNSDLLQHLGSQVTTIEEKRQTNKQTRRKDKNNALTGCLGNIAMRCRKWSKGLFILLWLQGERVRFDLSINISQLYLLISISIYWYHIDKSTYLLNVAKVRLASISVYIAAVCLCCHLLRLVPTFWEVLEVVWFPRFIFLKFWIHFLQRLKSGNIMPPNEPMWLQIFNPVSFKKQKSEDKHERDFIDWEI